MSFLDNDDDVYPEIDAGDFVAGDRPLFELAIALRTGNLAEAEHHLDMIARIIGTDAEHEVECGRSNPRAKRAA